MLSNEPGFRLNPRSGHRRDLVTQVLTYSTTTVVVGAQMWEDTGKEMPVVARRLEYSAVQFFTLRVVSSFATVMIAALLCIFESCSRTPHSEQAGTPMLTRARYSFAHLPTADLRRESWTVAAMALAAVPSSTGAHSLVRS